MYNWAYPRFQLVDLITMMCWWQYSHRGRAYLWLLGTQLGLWNCFILDWICNYGIDQYYISLWLWTRLNTRLYVLRATGQGMLMESFEIIESWLIDWWSVEMSMACLIYGLVSSFDGCLLRFWLFHNRSKTMFHGVRYLTSSIGCLSLRGWVTILLWIMTKWYPLC